MERAISRETGGSVLRKYVPPAPPPETLYYDASGGDRPMHQHRCDHDGHIWLCNSPYCNSLNGLCPDHGGDEPFHIGREPWRR